MIGFVGLSHLGIVSSIVAASKGWQVIAVDENEKLAEGLQKDDLPILEKGLDELLRLAKDKIRFSSDIHRLSQCEVVYISQDVPTDQTNRSDLSSIQDKINKILPVISKNCVLVILCQVNPGFTRGILSLIEEKFSEKNISLIYQVETLIFGEAVERASHPERYIVGYLDGKKDLPLIYKNFLASYECPQLLMSYESAELAKISINMFLISSVTTTNLISEISEKIGANWEDIENSLRLDKRIGEFAYLKPGLGISGGNLERDLVTLDKLAKENGVESGLINAWSCQSSYRKDWVLRKIYAKGAPKKNTKIAIWGLAYKAGTHSVKNSPSIDLINHLSEFEVVIYDPILKLPIELKSEKVSQVDSIMESLDGTQILVIMTPWNKFASFSVSQISTKMSGGIIIDPFLVLKNKNSSNDNIYITMGK